MPIEPVDVDSLAGVPDEEGNCSCRDCRRSRGLLPFTFREATTLQGPQVPPRVSAPPPPVVVSCPTTPVAPADFPVPDGSEVLSVHGMSVTFGAPLDDATGGPLGCTCSVCGGRRAEAERVRTYNLRVARMRKAGQELQAKLSRGVRSGKIPYCKMCAASMLPICDKCGQCTRRGITKEQVQAFMLINQCMEPVDYEHGRLDWLRARNRPDDQTGLELWMSCYVRGCCRCRICSKCTEMIASPEACGYCGLHTKCGQCRCWACPLCQTRGPSPHETVCSHCNAREGCCCSCSRCPSCHGVMPSSIRGPAGELVANRCQSCTKCLACCRCVVINQEDLPMPVAHRRGVVYQRAITKFWDPSPSWGLVAAGVPHPDQRNPFKRYIGQEIEVGGNGTLNMNKIVVGEWKGAIVSDGSIPATGFEINTAPAAGDMFVKQIGDIVRECERTRVWADASCGLHTHVDASDFNIWAMRRLVNLYRRVEAHMYSMLPESRQNNSYCAACGENWWAVFNDPGKIRELKGRTLKRPAILDTSAPTRTLKGNLAKALYRADPNTGKTNEMRKQMATSIKRAKRDKGNGTRYRGLNVHSWMLRGTLEFRMGAPAIDIKQSRSYDTPAPVAFVTGDYIANWGILCASVVDTAAKWSDAQVSAFGKEMKGLGASCTWEEFRDQILPPTIRKWADQTRDYIKKGRS